MNPVALMAVIKINLLRRPMWHSCTVEECLDISRAKLNALIESGELAWAWNLGTGRARREIRILAHCVVEKQVGNLPTIGATRNLKLPEVVNLILPKTRETLRCVELQRIFHSGPDLIHDLHAAGELKRLSEKLPAKGPNSSPRFTRASLVKLLESRRVA